MPRTKTFCEVAVLEKAMELFWKKGYSATSIKDLVEHLEINRQSMYDTYGDKKALFTKAFQHYRNTNKKRVQSLLAEYPSVRKGIQNFFLSAIKAALEDKERKGCFVINCATELIPNHQEFLPLIASNRQEFEEIFMNYLQLGVEEGDISADKDLSIIASYLYTLYSGLQVNAKIHSDKTTLTKTVLLGLSVLD